MIFFQKKLYGNKWLLSVDFSKHDLFSEHPQRPPAAGALPNFCLLPPAEEEKNLEKFGMKRGLWRSFKNHKTFLVEKNFMLKRTSKNKKSQRAAGGPGQFFFENLNIAAFSKILIFWVKQSKIGFFGPSLFYKMLRVVVLV